MARTLCRKGRCQLTRSFGKCDRATRESRDPQFVPDPEFLESEYREAQAEASRELQLVLDPEFL